MEDSLEYSKEAILNLDIFFNNEINFFVEDSGKEYRYQTILEEIFNIKIETVFALGCKNNLKEKFKQLKREAKINESFFIADLDFDFILNKDIIEDEHFIYLQKYEIENYILEERAIIQFAKNQLCCMESQARKKVNYKSWLQKTNKDLYQLFILYLIVQENNLQLENTNQNPNNYFDENGKVNIVKVEKYYQNVKNILDKSGKDADAMIIEMKNRVEDIYNNDLSKVIKGKYIMTGVRKHLSNILRKEYGKKKNVNDKQLEDYLYDFFDKKSLMFIKDRVLKCIEQ